MQTVRLLNHIPQDLNILDLPVVFEGSLEACHSYCNMWAGNVWTPDSSVFGGYYANVENGDCLLIT